ncbi:hypothetical protein KKC44_01605 [Patescibacteria group bacterium]|nr:hypothetical protein [Patescibacteria group bacterium]
MPEIFSPEWQETTPQTHDEVASSQRMSREYVLELFNEKKRKFTRRKVKWFRQKNAFDCGPCVLLNALQFLGVTQQLRISPEQLNIKSIRERSNERRRELGEPELPPNGWFHDDIDIYTLLKEIGLHINVVTDPQTAEKLIEEHKHDLIITGSGSHFRAFVYAPDKNLIVLDSMCSGPQLVSSQDAKKAIGLQHGKKRDKGKKCNGFS